MEPLSILEKEPDGERAQLAHPAPHHPTPQRSSLSVLRSLPPFPGPLTPWDRMIAREWGVFLEPGLSAQRRWGPSFFSHSRLSLGP